jgi:sugar-phosphatase
MFMINIYCKAILFDLDGVLIDSTPAVTRVWTQWAIEHALDPAEVVRRAHGRPSISTIRHYFPNADAEIENREVERREMNDVNGIVVLPGTPQLLNALPPNQWTIVTSCTRSLAEVRLRAAGLPIPRRLLTCDDVKNGKPDPEPYLKGASSLGYSASDCVVVEDVPAGIRAGKAAGARVIAFTTTAAETELRNAGSDWITNNCASISVKSANDGLTLALEE